MVVDLIMVLGLVGAIACAAISLRQIIIAKAAERKLLARLEADADVRRILAEIYASDSGGRIAPERIAELQEVIARHLVYLEPNERREVKAGLLQDSLAGRRMYLAGLTQALWPRVFDAAPARS